MKKILIIAEKYSSNLGDPLIYSIVDTIFSKKYVTDSIDLSGRKLFNHEESSNFEKNPNLIKKVYKILKYNLKKIGICISGKSMNNVKIEFINNFDNKIAEYSPDCILFAGGQMFIDSFFSQIIYVLKYCEKNNIPVFFNACGCSNKVFLYEKRYMKKILKNSCVKYISLRDKYDIFKKYDRRNVLFETFDTAILSNSVISRRVFSENKTGIGIMYSNFYSYKQQFDFWSSILKKLDINNIDYEIFCNGSIDDYNFIIEICKKNNINLSKILNCPRSYNELIDIICRFDNILSMRLHSLIIAYSYKIPAIAISWDSKVKEFYKKIRNDDCCFNLDSNVEKVISSLLDLKDSSINISTNLKVEKKIEQNINRIFKLIDNI